jgi:CubicO group peptidase (beta-lactamase class C family)
MPKPKFAPGSQFQYSNSNYLLLGEIVRRVSGKPLPQFLAEQIFHPLGLDMALDPTGHIRGKAAAYESDSGRQLPNRPVGRFHIARRPTEWGSTYRFGWR